MRRRKSSNKPLPTYLPEYQHQFLNMTSIKQGITKTEYIRRILDDKIRQEYPAVEYERRRDELKQEIKVVELLIEEASAMEDHEKWIRNELERIVPNLAKGADPTPELASYVSKRLGLSWQDLWAVVEEYRETGKLEV